jgi:lipopolysaccharide export system protein LptA
LQTGDCGSSIKELHGSGNVTFTRNCRSGTADGAIVDLVHGAVTLIGSAAIVNPDSIAHGDKVTLNSDFNSVQVESADRSMVCSNGFIKVRCLAKSRAL